MERIAIGATKAEEEAIVQAVAARNICVETIVAERERKGKTDKEDFRLRSSEVDSGADGEWRARGSRMKNKKLLYRAAGLV